MMRHLDRSYLLYTYYATLIGEKILNIPHSSIGTAIDHYQSLVRLSITRPLMYEPTHYVSLMKYLINRMVSPRQECIQDTSFTSRFNIIIVFFFFCYRRILVRSSSS